MDNHNDNEGSPLVQLKLKPVEEIIRNCLGIVRQDLRSGLQKPGSRQDSIEDYLKDKDFK